MAEKDRKGTQRIPTRGKIKHLTYEHLFQIVKSFEAELRAGHFDLVVGIARSGIIPATIISQVIDVPVEFIQCGRTDDTPRFLTPMELKGKKILVVEDIIGLGLTIGRVVAIAKKLGAKVSTFCLFYDQDTAKLIPDYGFPTAHFIHTQWDRKENSPKSRAAYKAKNGRCDASDAQECFGTDLDGIFMKDVKRRAWRLEERLDSILRYRDGFPPLPDVPVINREDVYIITARPQSDYKRTREWLEKYGFADVQLVCRDASQYGVGFDDVARYKAEQITSIGISTYFESDLKLAVLIAKYAPCTDIYWWGRKERLRIYASPVSAPFFNEADGKTVPDGSA